MREVSKIVREWNGYREIFSRPQVTENSRQYLLLGAPVYSGSGGWAGRARGVGVGGASRGTIAPLGVPLWSERSSLDIDLKFL